MYVNYMHLYETHTFDKKNACNCKIYIYTCSVCMFGNVASKEITTPFNTFYFYMYIKFLDIWGYLIFEECSVLTSVGSQQLKLISFPPTFFGGYWFT